MATSKQPSARFRSATEFPKQVEQLPPEEIVSLYGEMRECLIFTNRSRSQLLRRNEEHKATALSLKSDLSRLQTAISQLNLEKQQLSQRDQATIAALQQEMGTMSSHLDKLSKAFEGMEDIDNAIGVMAIPARFNRFWQALKALVIWWREEQDDGSYPLNPMLPSPPEEPEGDRRDNPQMHTDPASVQRSLRD